MNHSVSRLRQRIFHQAWPIDAEIAATSAAVPSHAFLNNPSGQLAYVYLTRFVHALAEAHFHRPFHDLSVLDWGCGKGHVSKLLRDLAPRSLDSCDILSTSEDSSFGQQTPILERFHIPVKPLEHEYILPYPDSTFHILLSVGVLEHVGNDRASLREIHRVLRPGGLFFCFFLPTRLSWTQKVAHMRGNDYHDRLYTSSGVRTMLHDAQFDLLDLWYRQLLPKNTIRYPNFRLFEHLDQLATTWTPARYFATNIEFVAARPATPTPVA